MSYYSSFSSTNNNTTSSIELREGISSGTDSAPGTGEQDCIVDVCSVGDENAPPPPTNTDDGMSVAGHNITRGPGCSTSTNAAVAVSSPIPILQMQHPLTMFATAGGVPLASINALGLISLGTTAATAPGYNSYKRIALNPATTSHHIETHPSTGDRYRILSLPAQSPAPTVTKPTTKVSELMSGTPPAAGRDGAQPKLGAALVSRKEKSLGKLCKRFLQAMEEESRGGEDVHLETVARKMSVEKRRIYDIVNVMEALEAMHKTNKSFYKWNGLDRLSMLMDTLQREAMASSLPEQVEKVEKAMCTFSEFLPTRATSSSHACNSSDTENSPNIGGDDDEHFSSWEPGSASLVGWDGEGEDSPQCARDEQDEMEGERERGERQAQTGGQALRDKGGGKNSLAHLCRRFLMVLLCNPNSNRRVSLDVASTVLIKDPESEGFEPPSRSRCRRLYDIANVLVAMGLIRKVHYLFGTKKIPLFVYCGPEPSAQQALHQQLKQNQEDAHPGHQCAEEDSRPAKAAETSLLRCGRPEERNVASDAALLREFIKRMRSHEDGHDGGNSGIGLMKMEPNAGVGDAWEAEKENRPPNNGGEWEDTASNTVPIASRRHHPQSIPTGAANNPQQQLLVKKRHFNGEGGHEDSMEEKPAKLPKIVEHIPQSMDRKDLPPTAALPRPLAQRPTTTSTLHPATSIASTAIQPPNFPSLLPVRNLSSIAAAGCFKMSAAPLRNTPSWLNMHAQPKEAAADAVVGPIWNGSTILDMAHNRQGRQRQLYSSQTAAAKLVATECSHPAKENFDEGMHEEDQENLGKMLQVGGSAQPKVASPRESGGRKMVQEGRDGQKSQEMRAKVMRHSVLSILGVSQRENITAANCAENSLWSTSHSQQISSSIFTAQHLSPKAFKPIAKCSATHGNVGDRSGSSIGNPHS